jgi:hypothetical protein
MVTAFRRDTSSSIPPSRTWLHDQLCPPERAPTAQPLAFAKRMAATTSFSPGRLDDDVGIAIRQARVAAAGATRGLVTGIAAPERLANEISGLLHANNFIQSAAQRQNPTDRHASNAVSPGGCLSRSVAGSFRSSRRRIGMRTFVVGKRPPSAVDFTATILAGLDFRRVIAGMSVTSPDKAVLAVLRFFGSRGLWLSVDKRPTMRKPIALPRAMIVDFQSVRVALRKTGR